MENQLACSQLTPHLSIILEEHKKNTLSSNDKLQCYTIIMKEPKTSERTLNKKQLERIIIIHNAIKSGLYPNAEKLQKLYLGQTGYTKVGIATIHRAIDALRVNFGAPLEFDIQKGGYYYSDENFEFALNSISPEEAFYLSAAKTLLSSFEGSPFFKQIADAIDFVTDTQKIGKSALLKRIAVPPTPKFVTNEEIWKKVLEALQKNLIVEFDYNGRWTTEITHRRIHPYQILMDDGLCLLFGYSEEREAERLFVLNRMSNFKVTEEKFDLPEDFEFSTRCGGGKFGAFMSEESYDFVIDFYSYARSFVKECVWAENQKITDFDEEGKTRIEFSSSQWLGILEWVLARGGNAVPIAPDWFVDEWKEKIAVMAENAEVME